MVWSALMKKNIMKKRSYLGLGAGVPSLYDEKVKK